MWGGSQLFHSRIEATYRRVAYAIIALAALVSMPLWDGGCVSRRWRATARDGCAIKPSSRRLLPALRSIVFAHALIFATSASDTSKFA